MRTNGGGGNAAAFSTGSGSSDYRRQGLQYGSALGLVLLLASGSSASAQIASRTITVPVIEASDIAFRPISTTGSFARTRVQQIVQDDQGFLWFATIDGLVRYDGYSSKRFDHDPSQPDSLAGVYVRSLFKDRSGILWIASDYFLDRFDPRTETFTHYRVDPREPEGLAVTVNHISEDRDGELWLSTGSGLYKFEQRSGRITRYAHDAADPNSLGSNDIKSSGEDRSGAFWVASGEELDKLDRTTGKVTLRIPLEEQRRFWFYEDQHGVFWIYSTSARGLTVLDRQKNELIRYSFHGPSVAGSAPPGVSAVLEDHDGTLWFGTGNAGLFKFDREHGTFIQYRNDRDDGRSLGGNTVVPQSLIEDREGHIWVGLEGVLPAIFSKQPSPFTKLPVGPQGASSVTSLFEDHDGVLWVGYLGALSGIEPNTGRRVSYGRPGVQPAAPVQAMVEDSHAVLWAGTSRGLFRLDRSGDLQTFRHDPANPFSLSHDAVRGLLVDRDGILWVTTDDGLNRYDAATARFAAFKPFAEAANASQYLGLTQDPHGALWLASNYSGVQRFDPGTSRFDVYLHKDGQPGSLSNNRVNAVHVDRAGRLWVGTQDGLNKFDAAHQSFSAYYEKDGLPGNVVTCILEDADGHLWMSTDAGLSSFDPSTEKFQNYSLADGLPATDLTAWKPCFKNRDGKMFFSGFGGAIAFDPRNVAIKSFVPPIVLTDLRVAGVPLTVGPGSILRQPITQGGTITLGYQQNTLSFEFSALSFLSPETRRYRFKLEGLDRDWNEVDSNRRAVTYGTLRAGEYVFRAQAAVTPAVWGEPGASLRIRIMPAWWRTWWFLTVAGGIVIGLIWTAHRVRLRIVEKHGAEIVALNERLMLAQEQERMRISAELHDGVMQQMLAVTMMLGTAKRRIAGDSNAKPTIDQIEQKLIQIGTDIRQLSHGLHPPVLEDAGLPEAVRTYCEQFSASGGIAISCVAEDRARDVSPAAALALFRILQEALGNAAKHAHATQITVRLSRSVAAVSLEVSDNGTGFDQSRLGSGGLGLITMRERAAQQDGKFRFETAPGRGTTITVSIPCR